MIDGAGSPGSAPRAPRSFHHREFPAARIAAERGATTVSVCLPARDEAATIGPIVEALRDELVEGGAVDEVVVIDDHSTDRTAEVARRAGARVVHAAAVLPQLGDGHGKGGALWKSLYATNSDLVVWCDSDIVDFGTRFVTGVLGPLVCEPGVDLVKGHYRRPEREREGGGRVTELVARPLLSLLFPELAGVAQPLSGEYGGRREVLERLPFSKGYGVDIGLLIDLSRQFGLDGLVQVDLDVRHHRNRSLADLGPQAMAIVQTVLRRVDPSLAPAVAQLRLPDLPAVAGALATGGPVVDVGELPPMLELEAYRARRSAASPN